MAVPSSSGTTLCTAYRPHIQWYRNGDPLPDANTPCITTDATGSYTVDFYMTLQSTQPQRYAARALSDQANMELKAFYGQLIADAKTKGKG